MSGSTARTLACAADLLARSLKLRYDGTAIASRMPRMMMTTRSSISVKPCSEPRRDLRRAIIGRASPSREGWHWVHRLAGSSGLTHLGVFASLIAGDLATETETPR